MTHFASPGVPLDAPAMDWGQRKVYVVSLAVMVDVKRKKSDSGRKHVFHQISFEKRGRATTSLQKHVP